MPNGMPTTSTVTSTGQPSARAARCGDNLRHMMTVLVANRGEIARRVFRTAKRMGLRTAAVYSDADLSAPFVREADAAIRIGPAPLLAPSGEESRAAAGPMRVAAAASRTGRADGSGRDEPVALRSPRRA